MHRLRNLHYRTFLSVAALAESRLYRSGHLKTVAAVSSGIGREVVAAYGVDPTKVAVVFNAVDPRMVATASQRPTLRLQARSQLGIHPDEVILLFVGAGDWKRKGLGLVLEALARLRQGNWRLLVVGSGDIEFYSQSALSVGLRDKVIFAGFRRRVEDCYFASDLFVYPSGYEAFPLVALEAAGAGLPLVVTEVNGVAEFIEDGRNGLIVEREAESIAEALSQLIDDRELRGAMGLAAELSVAGFTRQRVADAFFEICSAAAPTYARNMNDSA
jgi:UDP-glucose:(heptosyl)LPS alpha-1,3-glucosyltransferase